jgi:HAD superfamily hydrolase (TIGR01549 family)
MNNETSKKIALSVLQALFHPSDVKALEELNGILLCGFPGSGKSTIADLLHNAFGFEIISTDQVRTKELFKGQKHRMTSQHDEVMVSRYLVYEELSKRICRKANGRTKIVVDGTNLDAKRLALIGALLTKLPTQKVGVVVIRTPEWIIKERFINRSQEQFNEWWGVYSYWKKYVKEGKASFPTKSELPLIKIVHPRRYAIKTFDWVTEIKGIIWDLDGTLLQIGSEIQAEIDLRYNGTYAKAKSISLADAKRKISERYKQLGSYTKVMDEIGVNGKELLAQIFRDIDYADYLEPDLKIRKALQELNHLQHFIFNNAEREGAVKKLAALGLGKKLFSKIFCSYEMKWPKHDPTSFRYICRKTGLKPSQLLSVGDREKSDIIPAQAIGMRTCMVYGSSKVADVSLKNHYEVAELFGKEV